MNIRDAKQEIIHTIEAYRARDGKGRPVIERMRQRPILLMGPPGIGKTQIMEEIASDLSIGLLSYSITHLTRQSAVGLPMIREEEFDGRTVSVTKYTMSEILAEVHHKIRDEGRTEGILFLDEINCVSETLHPALLQFLQFKTFANEPLPDGWILVAAGNPLWANKSAREFDLVTLDRVREIKVEPSLAAWMEYAENAGVHGAVRAYLELKNDHFYRIREDTDDPSFVTARGWEDLSKLILAYERQGVLITAETVREFLHDEEIAEDFTAFLTLYRSFLKDDALQAILAGRADGPIYERAMKAPFDERLALTVLLFDAFRNAPKEETLTHIFEFLRASFGEERELLLFVTSLTRNADTAVFLAEHPHEEYLKYSRLFLMDGRRQEILKKL